LEYCAAVWDPHKITDQLALESVQRRAARFTKRDYSYQSSVSQMLQDLQWQPFKERRREIRLTLLFRIVQGKIAIPVDDIVTRADARHDYKFRHISATTQQYNNSFFVAIVPQWNTLPQSAVNADSVSAFKTQLRSMP